jgi:hypothetical protein
MDLLSAAKSAASLKQFLEEDILSLLASIEYNAAANALASAKCAEDKKSVYWSAINHLETAEESLKQQLKSYDRHSAAQKYIFIAAVKATILRHLGEEALVLKCFEETLTVVRLQHENEKKSQFKDLFSSWNPQNWIALRKYLHSNFGKQASSFDARLFWKQLIGRDGSFGLLSISVDN